MSPFSAPVLGGAALVTAPAWLHAVQGTSTAGDAVTRYLIAVAICWVALELWSMFVGPAPQPEVAVDPSAGPAAGDAALDEAFRR